MGFLDRLLGRDDSEPQNDGRYDRGSSAGGRAPQGAGRSEDEIALERYRYLLRTAPPETIEQVHAEAFAKLTPEQRRQVFEDLTRTSEPPANDNPDSLARSATRAELRSPGTMERAFGGGGNGGGMGGGGMGGGGMGGGAMRGGPSFGSMVGSSILGTVAGYVIGSALVSAFLPDPGYGEAAGDGGDSGDGGSDGGADAQSADAGADTGTDTGGDFGGGDSGWGGGGDSGWGGGGDFGGGDFGGGDFGGGFDV